MPPRTLRPWPISRHDLASGAATGFPLANSARSRSNAARFAPQHRWPAHPHFTPLRSAQQCVESYHAYGDADGLYINAHYRIDRIDRRTGITVRVVRFNALL